jgi:hypothetical protein
MLKFVSCADEARKVSMENMCNCTLITKVEGLESPPTGFLSVDFPIAVDIHTVIPAL